MDLVVALRAGIMKQQAVVVVIEQEAICLRRAKEAIYGNAYKHLINLLTQKFISSKCNLSIPVIIHYLHNFNTR